MFLLLCCRPARHTLCAAVRRAYVFFLVFTNSLSENILDSDVVCKAMQIGKVALTFVVQGCPPPVRGTEPVVSGVRSGSRTLSLSFRLCAHLHDSCKVYESPHLRVSTSEYDLRTQTLEQSCRIFTIDPGPEGSSFRLTRRSTLADCRA